MAGTSYQSDLIKLYLAAFIRAPEKSGLEYWMAQLSAGKSFDSVLETVFSLDIVKQIYPEGLSNDAFVTLIYVNVFGKAPDVEGLNYWSKKLTNGQNRGNLVMDMINTGLSTPDGTPGKAYIVNRLAVAEFAVGQQNFQRADFTPAYLKSIMATVNADSATVTTAESAMNSSVTGIGLGAPLNSLSIAAAANGLSAAEVKAGVTVVVDLTGTNAAAGNVIELLIDQNSFPTPVTKTLVAADITAKKLTLIVPATSNWGFDGLKLLTVFVKDGKGGVGLAGGDLIVNLDQTAPKAPTNSLVIAAAANGISAAEKAAGVEVVVDLSSTGAKAGDKLEILLDGAVLSPTASATLTNADISSGSVKLTIPVASNLGADGTKVFAARLTDVAGNVGGIGGNLTVSLDTTAPAAYKNTLIIDAAVGGISPTEKAANIIVQASLAGTSAVAGDSIELLIDGKPFANSTMHLITDADITAGKSILTIVGGDSAWGTVDGDHLISARLVDAAGNTGTAGGDLKVTVDSVPPNSQTLSISVPAATNGLSASEIAAGVDVVVNLNGANASAGDTLSVLLDGVAFVPAVSIVLSASQVSAKSATVKIPSTVNWGIDGNKALAVSIRDSAGNIGSPSTPFVVTVDKTAPAKLNTVPVIAAATSNINSAEKTAGVSVVVDITGSGVVVGDKLEVLLNGASFSTPVIQSIQTADLLAGSVNLTIPAAVWGSDGSKQIAARVLDLAGNVGVSSDAVTVVLDTTAPSAPSTTLSIPANAGGGLTPAERGAGVAVTVDLTGTGAAAGDSVEILIGGNSFSTPVRHVLTAGEISAHLVTLSIGSSDGWGSNGSKELSARFVDTSGNLGIAGGKATVNVLAPSAVSNALVIPAAAGGINPGEKAAGVNVTINLSNTNVQVGDAVELLIDGKPFTNSTLHALTAPEILAGTVTVTIAGGDTAWGLVDGDKTISVRIVDTSGAIGLAGGNLKVTLDSSAPSSQNLVLTVPAALNGLNASEVLAGVDVNVALTGTGAVAGDTLTLLLGGVAFTNPVSLVLSSAQVTAKTATISIPSTAGWGADGNKVLSAMITDSAGNQGQAGGALSLVLDTAVPTAPSNPIIVPAATNSINSAEKIAGVSVLVDLTGTGAVAGDKVEILIGSASFPTAVMQTLNASDISNHLSNVLIPGTASWGADGLKLLSARVVDAAGNLGTASAALSVNLDTSAPAGPTVQLQVPANAGGGISPAERTAGVAVNVDLTGTLATVGDTLEILIGGSPFSTPVTHQLTLTDLVTHSVSLTIGTADGWGADGNKVLSARFVDTAGNPGVAGGATTVNLDGTPPGVTATPMAVPSASNGINGAELSAGVIVNVDLNGTNAIAGDTLEVLINGISFSTPVRQVLSSAQVTAKLASVTIPASAGWGSDGNKTLSVFFTDVLGNAGSAGGSVTVSLDTVAPNSPTNSLSIPAASNGVSASERSAGLGVLVDLTGTGAVVGDKLELLVDGASFSSGVSVTLNSSQITAGLVNMTIPSAAGWGSDGSKVISARVIDFAGNAGVAGGGLTLNLDTVAPNAPSSPLSVPANGGGGVTAAEKSAGVDVSVSLTGTNVQAGDTVEVLLNNNPFTTPITHVLTAPEIASGSITLTVGPGSGWGADGAKTLTARFIDVAGNIGSSGGSISITILDTTAPNAPVSALYVPSAVAGISASEKSAGVLVTGYLAGTFAVAGDTAQLLIDGSPFASPVTHVLTSLEVTAGNFNFTVPNAAGWGADGSHILTMQLTDSSGNASAAGGAVTVNLDTTAPLAPSNVISVPIAANGINSTEKSAGVQVTVDLTGTNAVANDSVEILLGGSSFAVPVLHALTAPEISAHFATVTIPSGAGWGADGTKTISAQVIDVAGNVGLAGGSLTTVLETSMPSASGLPAYTDVDSSGTISATDTYVFTISEATDKAVGIGSINVSNSHTLGTGATAVWSSDGIHLTLTLGTGTSVAIGDTISLIGVADPAGNMTSLSFTI